MKKTILLIYILLTVNLLLAQNWQKIYFKNAIYSSKNQQDSVILLLSDCIKDNKNIPVDFYLMRGEAYFKQQNYTQAIADFEQVEKIHPGQASYRLSQIYAVLQNDENTVLFLTKHLKSNYKHKQSFIKNDTIFNNFKETSHWNQIWIQSWYSQYEIACEEAVYYQKRGLTIESLEQLNRIIEQYPNKNEAYRLRAELFLTMNNLKSALDDYNLAIELKPHNADFYIQRAKIYVKLKKNEKVQADIKKAIKLDNNNIFLHYKKAGFLYQIQNYSEAQNAISIYLKYDNLNSEALLLSGKIYFAQKNYFDALRRYNKILSNDKANEAAYFERGKTYIETQTYKYAVYDFSMVLDLNPTNAQAYYFRAYAHTKLGNNKKAKIDLNKSKKLGSN